MQDNPSALTPEAFPPTEPNGADETRWDLEEGAEIVPGRFALKKLGGGSDYEAYLAWDDDLFSLVVAKCLRPHLLGRERSIAALAREAELLSRLNHPVVVRGYGAVLDGDRPHVVMEHLEGPNLASLIRRFGPLPVEQLLPLTVQICSAVHYLGQKEVVHLDIKPRNIIMGAPPRLIDLSVARSFVKAGAITGHIGTDAYMAPEQCDPDQGSIGPEADVWGLGASLFHAATGQVPFPRPDYDPALHKEDLQRRFPQLSAERAPFPREVPGALQEAIGGCLSFDPKSRPLVKDVVSLVEPLIARLPKKPFLGRSRPGRRARRDPSDGF